jgi:hypothetical protein
VLSSSLVIYVNRHHLCFVCALVQRVFHLLLPAPHRIHDASQPLSQDFRQAQSTKRKRGPHSNTDRTTASSSSFISPNQFAVLSDSETKTEELNYHPQPSDRQPRIPPIVIYSFLTNHSSTLQKVNNKLSAPVEVKTKLNRLLLYTKTTQDYSTVLSEIQAAKLEYHTYPLPDTLHTRLVLKGIPPNVPEEDICEVLVALDIQRVKIYQITKTDKTTREVLTRYPVFVVTFSPGTDVRKVLQISKLCHCIIRWEKYKNSRPVQQCYNCQAFRHSSNFCGKSSKCVRCDQPHQLKTARKITDLHRNALTVEALIRLTSQAARSIFNRFNINK